MEHKVPEPIKKKAEQANDKLISTPTRNHWPRTVLNPGHQPWLPDLFNEASDEEDILDQCRIEILHNMLELIADYGTPNAINQEHDLEELHLWSEETSGSRQRYIEKAREKFARIDREYDEKELLQEANLLEKLECYEHVYNYLEEV